MKKEYKKVYLLGTEKSFGMIPNVREVPRNKPHTKSIVYNFETFPVYCEVIEKDNNKYVYDIITGTELFFVGKNYFTTGEMATTLSYIGYEDVDKDIMLRDFKLLTEEDIKRYTSQFADLGIANSKRMENFYKNRKLSKEASDVDEILERAVERVKRIRKK